jgi:magnesium transporter
MDQTEIRLIDFDDLHLTDQKLLDISDAARYRTSESKTWINVNGLHDVAAIGNIGQVFGLHPLVLEDILNTGQRPKIDDYGSYLFIVLKMIRYDKKPGWW